MEKYLKIFKALSDKTRLRIVLMLRVKPMCVCEIREIIGFSMSTVSNHLKIIKEAGIITSEKKDKFINYQLNTEDSGVREILKILNKINNEKIVENDARKALVTDRVNIC